MFGLSLKEKLATAIIQKCQEYQTVYRNQIADLCRLSAKKPDISQNELDHVTAEARKEYFNAIFDDFWNGLGEKSGYTDARIRLALHEPTITGLPSEMTLEYFDENGFSAAATFAFMYYAISGKPVNMIRDAKQLSRLNHIQNEIMDEVLRETHV